MNENKESTRSLPKLEDALNKIADSLRKQASEHAQFVGTGRTINTYAPNNAHDTHLWGATYSLKR